MQVHDESELTKLIENQNPSSMPHQKLQTKMVAKAYNNKAHQPSKVWYYVGIMIGIVLLFAMFLLGSRINNIPSNVGTASLHDFEFLQTDGNNLKSLTWNMAAINNNPFEYWITTDISSYNDMMKRLEEYIKTPSAPVDVVISSIFTDAMFDELISEMQQNTNWISTAKKAMENIDIVKDKWHKDYKNRKAISQFLKDPLIGKKRLASMPDRLTNTINVNSNTYSTEDEKSPLTRPTVINCYSGDLSTMSLWWTQWKDFMFRTYVPTSASNVKNNKDSDSKRVVDSLLSIKRSKYPAVTEEEEIVSLPLQLLSLAIFDSILVNTLNIIAGGVDNDNGWQPLRNTLCNKLNRKKAQLSIDILEKEYQDSNVMFLQEVGSAFINVFKRSKRAESFAAANALAASASIKLTQQLRKSYDMYIPIDRDGDRDQNSVILLRKGQFSNAQEVTEKIVATLTEMAAVKGEKVPISKGDLISITAVNKKTNEKYLLCSFHGDTNGLATIPVLAAVRKYAMSFLSNHILLFGMDGQ